MVQLNLIAQIAEKLELFDVENAEIKQLNTNVLNVGSKGLIKMGLAVVTVRIMPASPDVDLNALEIRAKEEIVKFAGEGETRTKIEPVAFGLNSLDITFVMDEKQGSPDPVAEAIDQFEEVNSAEITDVRRALG